MTTYVYRDGALVEKHLAGPLHDSDAAPAYISDIMGPLRHMANGRMYDSKSEFRRATRAAGCVEVGDHTFKPRQPIKLDRRERAMDIKRSIEQLKAR